VKGDDVEYVDFKAALYGGLELDRQTSIITPDGRTLFRRGMRVQRYI
jgi:hypothetical protein